MVAARYLLILMILFSVGCINRFNSTRPEPQILQNMVSANSAQEKDLPKVVAVVRRYPWELWASGQSPRGEAIKNLQLLNGDRFRDQGLIKAAAEQFYSATKLPLAKYEVDSAQLRLASIELMSGNSSQTLLILSDYMKKLGLNVAQVDPYFGLVFAFAYGAQSDYEQSLAWFSQVLRTAQSDARIAPIASKAVTAFIQTLPQLDFERVKSVWLGDLYLAKLIQQEADRRVAGGPIRVISPGRYFWDGVVYSNNQRALMPPVAGGTVRVIALLPLSGTYAALGNNAKRGLELSIAGEQKAGIDLSFIDTKEDPIITTDAIRRESARGGNVVFVGPILSPAANAAAETARQLNVPLIALTKSETFASGQSVMRLGPTPSSQIASLLDQLTSKLGLRTFGVIYPRTAQGEELLEVFNRELAARRLPLVYSQVYENQEFSGFLELGTALETKSVDAIFVADDLSAASRLSLSLSEKRRKQLKIVGTARWDNQSELSRSMQALDGIIFTSGMKRDNLDPILANFYQAHNRGFGTEPDFMAAQGFDIGILIAAAAKQNKPIIEALRSLKSYGGITGNISTNASGDFVRRFRVVQFKNGVVSELSPERELITQVGDSRVESSSSVVTE